MRAIGLSAVTSLLTLCLLAGCDASRTDGNITLVIDSRPVQGADVLINGQPSGKVTPATVAGLPNDTVLVQVEKEGYKTAWRNVTPKEGQEQRVLLDLEPRVGYLSVESNPSGAQVVMEDGTVLGVTPISRVPVQVGEHTYEVRHEQYKTASKTFTVDEYFPHRFVHDLEPRPASIEILSRPSGALVFINEQFQGKRTPATFELSPGTYTVSVQQSGYVTTEDNVTIGPSEQKSIVLEMKEGDIPPGMVLIPAGEFIMGFDQGAPDERPRRKVDIPAFFMDKFEVTNQEFKRVFPDHAFERGKENHPVVSASWEEASEYAKAVGKRLPTEEEWEKAARGPDGWEYPWGNEFDPELCNSAEKLTIGVEEVGKYRAGASPYGCMDMAGNAYEWTSSFYNAYPGNTDIEKDYGLIFRVLRGGSYLSNKFDVRCASRHYDREKSAKADYGFRCARDADTTSPQATSTSRGLASGVSKPQ